MNASAQPNAAAPAAQRLRVSRHVTMLIAAIVVLLTAANVAAADGPWGVAHLVGASEDPMGRITCRPQGCEWRVYRPDTDDHTLVTVLPEFPHAVIWNSGFDRVEYRAGHRIYRMSWTLGARPELLGILPQTWDPGFEDNEPWVDRQSGAWRVRTAEGRGAGYRVRIVELETAGQWRTVAEATGCLNPACWAPVYQAQDRRAFNSAAGLLAAMRMPAHMPRARFIGKPAGPRDEVPVQVLSRTIQNRALRMLAVAADSWHALAPITWLDVDTQRRRLIPSAGAGCRDEVVAFDERGPFLLVVEELRGRCAIVVDMRSGAVRRRIPDASLAIWVRTPAGGR